MSPLVLRDDANDVMDRLYDVGAKGIFVTQVHAARF